MNTPLNSRKLLIDDTPSIRAALRQVSGFEWSAVTWAQEGLQTLQTAHALAFEQAFNAVVVVDCQAPHYPIAYVNPAFERITGYAIPRSLGRSVHELFVELDAAVWGHKEPCIQRTLRTTRQDGTPLWLEIRWVKITADEGRVTHCLGVLNDITAACEQRQALEFQAHHDTLTGLPNRAMLRDRLVQAMAFARRKREKVAVLWLDMDHFKFINDSYGHQVGDDLLVALAKRLRGVIRESDTVARLGGDEFVVLMPSLAKVADAATAAQKVLDVFTPPFKIQDHLLHVSTSLGVSLYPDDATTDEQLLMFADTAMYRAKNEGRNTFQFYSREMSQEALERERLSHALHIALAQNQFELHYQPMLDLKSNRVVGVEALIRWRHPEWGLVSPGSFIPLAEETGLIVAIGRWVLDTACLQAQAWQDRWQVEVSVSVNVSARQFRQHDLPEVVKSALAHSGLSPRLLEIELTESLLMQQTDVVVKTLNQIKALGVSLALDDFGTGYSSLSYLRRFPLDVLKIDRSFVSGLVGHQADAAITRAIISMAHSLGLTVVAEGVESPDQLAFLQANRCDEAQGFLLGRPVPAADLDDLWRAQSQATRQGAGDEACIVK